MKNRLMFALLCLVASFPLFADDDSTPDDTFITLTRTPVRRSDLPTNVTVVTADDIQKAGARTVGEALKLLPGMQISEAGSIGSLSSVRIRGVPTSNQVQILLDDQPLGGVSIQSVDLSLLPVDNIERIEIVRGGASVLYGANTIGGVVHIITKKHTSNTPTASLSMQQGSLDTAKVAVDAGAKNDRMNVYGSAAQYSTDGFQDNTDVHHRDGSLTAGYGFESGASLQASMSAFGNEGGASSGTPVPESEWDGHKEREAVTPTDRFNHTTETARLRASAPVAQIGTTEILGYQSRENYHYASPFGNNIYDNRIGGVDARLTLDRGTTLGASYEKDGRYAPDQPYHSAKNSAVYAQQQAKLGRWLLIPAVRYDHHSQFGGQTDPRLTAVFQANPNFKISGNAARSYRAPQLTDLYDDFPQFSFFANPNLKPESAWTYDTGVWLRPVSNVTFQLSGFYTAIEDRITLVKTNATDFSLENLNRAQIYGTEIEATWEQGAFTHSANATLQEGLGTPTPTATSPADSHYVSLNNTPKYLVNYQGALHLPHQWSWRNDLHFQGKSFERDDNAGAEMPSHYWWNMRVEKIVGSANLFIEARNLTDQHYAETTNFGSLVPQPGRTYGGGVKISFGEK